MNKIVEIIHNEIDTAADRLLKEAEGIISNTKAVKPNTDKADRLRALGFGKAAPVQAILEQEQEFEKGLAVIATEKSKADIIKYYKITYPFLRFLTEEELIRICDKYSLIYAPVPNFIKDVPEKNLVEIERAQKLKNGDEVETLLQFNNAGPRFYAFMKHAGFSDLSFTLKEFHEKILSVYTHLPPKWKDPRKDDTGLYLIWERLGKIGYYAEYSSITVIEKSDLFIAAPSDHFDLKDLSKEKNNTKGFFRKITTIKPDDPIVFRYVRGGVQVLSKWGGEADDPMLTNELTN